MNLAADIAFRILGLFFIILSLGVTITVFDDYNIKKGYFIVVGVIIGFVMGIILVMCGSNVILLYLKWIADLSR